MHAVHHNRDPIICARRLPSRTLLRGTRWPAVPKIVDQVERREQVAAAVLAVAARTGLAKTTLRDVAREAGCSTGMLSHYFRDKHELLLFAFRLCGDRLMAARARIAPGSSPLTRVRDTLVTTMPLDDDRRAICAIMLEFSVWSLYTPDMAELFRDAHSHWCR